MKIRAHHSPWDYAIQFAAIELLDGVRSVAKPLEFEVLKEGLMITNPTFQLTEEDAQELFNDLWRIGLRPKDGTGNSGHVAAIQYHLEDMRKLVFDKPTA